MLIATSKERLIPGGEHWGRMEGQEQRDDPPGAKLSSLCSPTFRTSGTPCRPEEHRMTAEHQVLWKAGDVPKSRALGTYRKDFGM